MWHCDFLCIAYALLDCDFVNGSADGKDAGCQLAGDTLTGAQQSSLDAARSEKGKPIDVVNTNGHSRCCRRNHSEEGSLGRLSLDYLGPETPEKPVQFHQRGQV